MLTVTAVVATLPLALIPALNGLGWHSLNAASLNTQLVVALITLVVITVQPTRPTGCSSWASWTGSRSCGPW